jgi:hypothetical protein
MATMREKFEQLRADFQDTVNTFATYVASNRSTLSVTGEVVGYIEDKCGEELLPAQGDQLSEMRRDCAIISSRLSNLRERLNLLGTLFAGAQTEFDCDATSDERLIGVFDGLVQSFIGWYDLYNDFKGSFKKAKAKWQRVENGILASVR